MKIMITGAKGQLGKDCTRVLETAHDITALTRKDLDITVFSNVEDMVKGLKPDVILNCSAYTQVDNCESEKKPAWEVNVKGPKNLALCARIHGSRLIQISTDYIFDGMKETPAPYMENDAPHPLSYYGVTKLEGENAIRRHTDQYMILRTAWMYGLYGKNFLKTMLKLALKDQDRDIKVVNDQYGSPTWSYRLAVQISKLIEENGQGTYHATSEGYCTWYELAVYFLGKMDIPHRLVPCVSQEYPTPAARPKNSILENLHLKEEGINIMRHWQDDLDQFVAGSREQLINEVMSEQKIA